jgi:hypothetical protein
MYNRLIQPRILCMYGEFIISSCTDLWAELPIRIRLHLCVSRTGLKGNLGREEGGVHMFVSVVRLDDVSSSPRHFVSMTFRFGDILFWRHFVLATFCFGDISFWQCLVLTTIRLFVSMTFSFDNVSF